MNKDTDHKAVIYTHLNESADVTRRVAEQCYDSILAAVTMIVTAFRAGNKLLLCGNGGSASDCQHVAAEFVNRLSSEFERPGLPALALTADSVLLTAYSNDYSFDGVFARQVETLGNPGDVLIGISTSGSSANVVRAVEVARTRNMGTIALMGERGTLEDRVDVAIKVPATKTQYIQEAHLSIEHILCHLVEIRVFADRINA